MKRNNSLNIVGVAKKMELHTYIRLNKCIEYSRPSKNGTKISSVLTF